MAGSVVNYVKSCPVIVFVVKYRGKCGRFWRMKKRFERKYVITLIIAFMIFFLVIGFILLSFFRNASKNIVALGEKIYTTQTLGEQNEFQIT